MLTYTIDPLRDARWPAFIESSRHSSIFHTRGWLEALDRTYGYHPVAFTTSAPDRPLEDAVVFCRVASWITGRRLVSLPFSDHCDPLVDSTAVVVRMLEEALRREKLRYVEIRPREPIAGVPAVCNSTHTYAFHEIDLRPDLDTLFANCHKSSTQRKILRARREGLHCETGRSPALLDAFWRLFLITRRKHHAPPQPKHWFRNLVDCLGEALEIRVASHGGRPVAAIMTLRHKRTLVYKYGCSDPVSQHLGGTHLLFWNAIEDARRAGLRTFDLGRSDCDNPGLITFKDRWGSRRSILVYSRFSLSPLPDGSAATAGWANRVAKRLVPCMPDGLLRLVGSVVYRHIG